MAGDTAGLVEALAIDRVYTIATCQWQFNNNPGQSLGNATSVSILQIKRERDLPNEIQGYQFFYIGPSGATTFL